MAQPIRIEPDLQFIQELQAVGGESLKKCYQCATCSVACPVSPTNNPYPRKEMIWAQWGMKDQLLSDIDIWLCHNCGTCSDLCPRGAKPGDLLAALRNMAYKSLTPLSFVGKWMSSAKYLPILFLLPAILFLAIWAIHVYGFMETPEWFPLTDQGEIVYGLVFPGDYTIDPLFGLVTLCVVGLFFMGVRNQIKSLRAEGSTLVVGQEKPSILKAFVQALIEIIPHKRFTTCGTEKADRKLGHLALFGGFVMLAVVTGTVAVGHWGVVLWGIFFGHEGAIYEALEHFNHWTHTPMPPLHLVKLLAYAGAASLVGGLALLTFRRFQQDDSKTSSNYYDWYLLGVIWAVGLTGVFSMLFRMAGMKYLAYPTYYLHLVTVFMLFAYLPWSKLAHLVYRTVAMTYANYRGRKAM
ncbi:MAG: heterodisulfide reductase subunit E [Desulfovibrio sp.]|nr:MAG: heterodisulfide reductase subunit E [Desulfovibrio sp.]